MFFHIEERSYASAAELSMCTIPPEGTVAPGNDRKDIRCGLHFLKDGRGEEIRWCSVKRQHKQTGIQAYTHTRIQAYKDTGSTRI